MNHEMFFNGFSNVSSRNIPIGGFIVHLHSIFSTDNPVQCSGSTYLTTYVQETNALISLSIVFFHAISQEQFVIEVRMQWLESVSSRIMLFCLKCFSSAA